MTSRATARTAEGGDLNECQATAILLDHRPMTIECLGEGNHCTVNFLLRSCGILHAARGCRCTQHGVTPSTKSDKFSFGIMVVVHLQRIDKVWGCTHLGVLRLPGLRQTVTQRL